MNKEAVPKQALKQKRFHEHYCSDGHNGIEDWVITLIGSADTLKELRKKDLVLTHYRDIIIWHHLIMVT